MKSKLKFFIINILLSGLLVVCENKIVNNTEPIPQPPILKRATNISQTGFTANWNPSSGASGYKIDVSKDSNFSSFISGYEDRDVGNITTTNVTNLNAGTTYYYRLRAYNSSGTSGNSSSQQVTTLLPPPSPSEMLAKLSEIQVKVFNVSCASAGCHSDSSSAANLSLTLGNSYNQLVNVNSLENPSMKRVLPGSSAQSLLIKKLEGNGTSVMPPSGKLSKEIIDTIKAWIDRGALNN